MSGATVLEAARQQIQSVLEPQPEDGPGASGAEALRELRHEIGNALTAAAAYTQWLLLSRSATVDEREYRALQAIRDSVARAIRLVDRRRSPREPIPHLLQDLVELAVQQVPSPRIQDIQVRRLTQEAPAISADPDAVIQIVTNLLSNAAKDSATGTPIDVELDRADGTAHVVVRDRGIGFSPELTEAIFNGHRTPQARQMAEGQGIGLRLSRRLAQEAGGRLWATGGPGRETSFHLELPLAELEAHTRSTLSPMAHVRLPAGWSDEQVD
jgi:signal transduction histidine kinase